MLQENVASKTELFSSGAQRDALSVRFDLIPPCALKELAKIYDEGAKKYGTSNWKKGIPYSNIFNHMLNHINLFMAGDRTEAHIAKAMWACAAILWYEENMEGLNDL